MHGPIGAEPTGVAGSLPRYSWKYFLSYNFIFLLFTLVPQTVNRREAVRVVLCKRRFFSFYHITSYKLGKLQFIICRRFITEYRA